MSEKPKRGRDWAHVTCSGFARGEWGPCEGYRVVSVKSAAGRSVSLVRVWDLRRKHYRRFAPAPAAPRWRSFRRPDARPLSPLRIEDIHRRRPSGISILRGRRPSETGGVFALPPHRERAGQSRCPACGDSYPAYYFSAAGTCFDCHHLIADPEFVAEPEREGEPERETVYRRKVRERKLLPTSEASLAQDIRVAILLGAEWLPRWPEDRAFLRHLWRDFPGSAPKTESVTAPETSP